MVLYHLRHSQNQRGIAVHRPVIKKGQASKTKTPKSTYTKGRTTYYYIDSKARPKPAHCIQPALFRIQGRSSNTPETKTGSQRYQ